MPNPKTGTVTNDIVRCFGSKKGKIASAWTIRHRARSIGRVSFAEQPPTAHELISTLVKMKPSSSKGVYMKTVSVASTMSPGIAVDPKSIKV
jgi:large subunit ribosomal protein L1